jgi:hypothetical protein
VLVLASDADVVGRFHHGIGVHTAHTVLGHVALADGDVALAIDHLRISGYWPKSPPHDPERSLAVALFDRGELEAVDDYVDACERFVGAVVAEGWRQLLAAGDNPFAVPPVEMLMRLRSTTG